ncbi:MAG: nucleotidyltransferase domain-containing protein [bacterium]
MADARTTAAKLTAQFRTTFADELRSVVVFGSLPRGEAIPGVSDLNILVLLESVAAPSLVRAAPVLQQWIRQGNTPPYIYSWNEWSGMQDTFALEIADMNDAREVLWGADPVSVEAVTYGHLRMQTEREVRDLLLHLRLRLMVDANGPTDVGALLMSGIPSFTAYMRAALRLAGEAPGLVTRPVIERTAALIGADASPMLTAFDARRTTQRLDVAITDKLVDQYMDFAQSLLAYINTLPEARARPDESGGSGTAAYAPSGSPRAGAQA